MPVNSLPTILKKLKLSSPLDLLTYYPTRYLDFSQIEDLSKLKTGETVTVRAKIKSIKGRFSFHTKKIIVEAVVSDNTGSLKITWFNQGYIAKTLKQGEEYFFAGTVENYNGLSFINPIHEKVTKESLSTGRLVPVYKLLDGLYQKTFRSTIHNLLPKVKEVEEILPSTLLKKFNILSLDKTIKELHFPTNPDNLKAAQKRLIFEEVFIQQMAVCIHKQTLANLNTVTINPDPKYLSSLTNSLPFTLTDSQKKAVWSILQDTAKGTPMNRLLQGDVGSGKTAVAFIVALSVIKEGFQTALLAPTEILAKQHYDGLCKFIGNLGKLGSKINTALFTRNFILVNQKETTKKEAIKLLETGKINFVIGTHALLQTGVKFKKLGLLTIDEQHRFGVSQRQNLRSRTLEQNQSLAPHLLSLSATPIPRSLALTLFGDLEVSQLNELPKGRQEIVSRVVLEENRGKAYEFIKQHLKTGRQCFIITPLVEESEKLAIKSVKAEFERLQKTIFKDFKLGLLYGSMKGQEKDDTMSKFAKGKINLLVATSVIEVGIDIPNATVIAIEGAERFGLAQLHQLRGRVGRGTHKSFCLLFPSNNDSNLERLEMFSKTSNGFDLAEIDLRQRGFGSLLGEQQSGYSFKYSQFLSFDILKQGRLAAEFYLNNHKLEKSKKLNDLVSPLVSQVHLE